MRQYLFSSEGLIFISKLKELPRTIIRDIAVSGLYTLNLHLQQTYQTPKLGFHLRNTERL